jgi:hypothetical protein
MSALAIYAQPVHEVAQYHSPKRSGFVALCYSTRSGRTLAHDAFERLKHHWPPENLPALEIEKLEARLNAQKGRGFRQVPIRLAQLPETLRDLGAIIDLAPGDSPETTGIWLSQAAFSQPNRQKINLAHLGVCWVDLDLHHENSPPHLRRLNPDEALKQTLARCQNHGLPPPSAVYWTGRGLAVKWYLAEPLPKAAYPRWAAVQATLVNLFEPLGGDSSAQDASRILRLTSTWNPKSAERCRPLFVNEFFGDIVKPSFDDLADAVLPIARADLAALQARRSSRTWQEQRLVCLSDGSVAGKQTANLKKFNPVRLAWLQLDDYRKLATLRPVTQRQEGWTNTLVWLATSALAMAVWASEVRWNSELRSLISELAPHWSLDRVHKATSSVRGRMTRMRDGDWIEWNGQKRPPLYLPRHESILQLLSISDAEAEQLQVIIPKELAQDRARQRDRQRKAEARRIAGKMRRADYVQLADARAQKACDMHAAGESVLSISATLQVSRGHVYRWLKDSRSAED